MRVPVLVLAALSLGACASAGTRSGFLSSYEGLTEREGTVRVAIAERRDAEALKAVGAVAIEPTTLLAGEATAWMTPQERDVLLREVDAQLCFELSERYRIASDSPDATVRAAVAAVRPTGRFASAASAAAGFFIPGPLGLRAPGTTGALAMEAEMLGPDARQLAAITWNRAATPIGTDTPSLSRIGDALQFAEPFADDAAKALSAPERKSGPVGDPDPCAAYGPRFRPEGWAAKFATGLYVPQMSGAREKEEEPAP